MLLTYPTLRRFGLGMHLAVIVGLAIVPLILLIVHFVQAERQDTIEDAKLWAKVAAHTAAEKHLDEVSDTEDLLTVSAYRLGKSNLAADQCVQQAGANHYFWLINSGDLGCTPGEEFPLTDEAGQELVRRTQEPGFSIVGPLEHQNGNLSMFGVLVVQADDGSVWRLIRSIEFHLQPVLDHPVANQAHLAVMAFDREGRIIERIGPTKVAVFETGLPRFDAIKPVGLVSGAENRSTRTVADIDGVQRIFGVAHIPGSDTSIVVGLSQDAVYAAARQKLWGSLALAGAALALSALVAWLIIERKVLRSVRRLRDAAVAAANGEESHRFEILDGPTELRELAEAFNDMTTKLQHQALHDQLTGLANRRLIAQRIESFVRDERYFSVLAVDLDGFKPVNDTYGHDVGDIVLREVAQRMQAALPQDATFGRTGGDEFLALIPMPTAGKDGEDHAVSVAKKMLQNVKEPIMLETGDKVNIGICVGISSWPQGDTVPGDIVRQADAELYRAKENGTNRYSVFDPDKGSTRAA